LGNETVIVKKQKQVISLMLLTVGVKWMTISPWFC